jgi:hypothetical protein
MRRRTSPKAAWVATTVLATVLGQTMSMASASGAASPSPAARFTATAVTATDRADAVKSLSGRLAQSDPALLSRTDSALVNVVVKVDFDATASYRGGVANLAPTSPEVTGRKLTGRSTQERAYEAYTGAMIAQVKKDAAGVAGATSGRELKRVYGGVAMQVPANRIASLLTVPNVTAVQPDTLNHTLTDSSNAFIGSPTLWAQEGGKTNAGKGVIFADLDSGLWPEHPSVADNAALGTPPVAPSGLPRACVYGDNPLTPAADPFRCNSKVIGGQPFLGTYNAIVGGEMYPDSARDSDGHGTHTTTTAAGDAVASAKIFGVERGPASGVAPGAWVIEYKVCGASGCFGSDTAAAVEQAIVDGADVINYSISGGANPYADLTELAFLDAYAAGVFVAASAGNSGPGAGTTDHRSPWVTTVAASTQTREFQSTVTVVDGATTAAFTGTSLTLGLATATPIILAATVPGYDKQCLTTPTAVQAAVIAGKVVACQRGGDTVGRVAKGFRLKGAGAAGMVLYNLPLADTESDNHFLPAVHLADGTALLAFLTAHPNALASFPAGVKANGQGDVMAAFSSRGPGGQFIKPDITAPGVQILAGNTPTPDDVPAGPAGEYYQAIAGTSMSAPHIAGSAILLAALHPAWGPGAIKSAMMTTAKTSVVKEDLVTPADAFDDGAGRIDLTKAGSAELVFEDTGPNFFASGADPVAAVNLNLPSVNAPTMPGTITVTRTARNVSGRELAFRASTSAPAGSTIRISPSEGSVRAGGTQRFRITITSSAPSGQYFGRIDITPRSGAALHLPVAFFNQQGAVSLTSACNPTSIVKDATTTCTVTAENQSFEPATVGLTTTASNNLKLTGATGATLSGNRVTAGPTTLAGKKDATPSITTIDPAITPSGGYLPLGLFGIAPAAVGDETILNFTVPGYTFAGRTFTRLGVTSNGYIVAGGGTAADVDYNAQTLPDPVRPNGVISPYWTDLDGAGQPGVSVGVLGDGVSNWIVVQWQVRYFGGTATASDRRFQVWLGANGTEDVTYAYDTGTDGVGVPAGVGPLTVGAENLSGTGGGQIAGAPTGMYQVTSTPGAPGGSLTYSVTARGGDRGAGTVTSTMTASLVPGQTVVSTPVTVTR